MEFWTQSGLSPNGLTSINLGYLMLDLLSGEEGFCETCYLTKVPNIFIPVPRNI